MPDVHPTAVVHPSAILHHGVSIGPMCVIGPDVELGPDSRLIAHVVVEGPTRMGARSVIHPFAALGGDPQHRDYAGERTRLEMGDDNVIREHVTVHRGTTAGGGTTLIGSECLLMAGAHVAHDARVGDHVTLTNGTLLGGHVEIGSWVVAAGHVAVAPFTRVGDSAFLAGNAMVERDVPPFLMAAGDRATLRAINRVGLQRRGLPEASMVALHAAFRALFALEGPRVDPQGPEAEEMARDPYVRQLLEFVRAPSRQGVAPRHRPSGRSFRES
jgi:UDP-N-acetylglucosamine acyltransferase